MTQTPNKAAGRHSGGLEGPGSSLFFAEVAFRGDTHRLARLLVDESAEREEWSEGELSSILAHQLDATIGPELDRYDQGSANAPIGSRDSGPTFRQLLFGNTGSVEALLRVKEYAKARMVQRDPCYPVEILQLLYYGSVMAARRFHDQRITSLSDVQFRKGVDWVLRQEWIEPSLRAWFRAAAECLTDAE
jgi:hypothetical protein